MISYHKTLFSKYEKKNDKNKLNNFFTNGAP